MRIHKDGASQRTDIEHLAIDIGHELQLQPLARQDKLLSQGLGERGRDGQHRAPVRPQQIGACAVSMA